MGDSDDSERGDTFYLCYLALLTGGVGWAVPDGAEPAGQGWRVSYLLVLLESTEPQANSPAVFCSHLGMGTLTGDS